MTTSASIILDIVFVLIAAIFIAVGIKKGFIKSLIQSAKLILSIVAAYFLGSQFGLFLKDKFIFKPVYDFVFEKVNGLYQDAAASLNTEELLSSFPQFLITDEVKQSVSNATSSESGTALVDSVTNSIADPVSGFFANLLGYVLVFVIAFVALTIVAWLLTKLSDKIGVLGTANRILGGVWGALMGAIVLFMIASIIKLIGAGTPLYTGTVIVKFFGDSALLEAIKIFNIGATLFA